MKKHVRIFLCGLLTFVIACFPAMFTTFKTGLSVVPDTALISCFLLMIAGQMNEKTLVITDVFARTVTSAMITVAGYIAVIVLCGMELQINQLFFIILLFGIAGCFGILFFSSVSAIYHNRSEFTFPQSTPRIRLIRGLGGGSSAQRNRVLLSGGLSAVCASVVRFFHILPGSVSVTDMIVISPNLITLAVGYFIKHKTYLFLLIGTAFSAAIALWHRPSGFSEHIQDPYIYSVIIAFSLSNGILVMIDFLRNHIKHGHNKEVFFLKGAMVVIFLWMVTVIVLFSGYVNQQLYIPFRISVILIPVATLLSISTLSGVAGTGYWISVIDDILPIGVILLYHRVSLYSLIVFVSALTVFEMCGIYYVINCDVANQFDIPPAETRKWSLLSAVFCSGAGMGMVFVCLRSPLLFTDELPAPLSRVFLMQIETLSDALSDYRMPGSIDPAAFFIAVAVAVILYMLKKPIMIILAGMVLPFGSVCMLGAGVLLSVLFRGKEGITDDVFSGMTIGGGLVSAAAIFQQAIYAAPK